MTALAVGQGESEDRVGQSLLRMADELGSNVSVTDSTWTNLAADHDVAWLMDAVESVAHVSFLCCLARSLGVQPASLTFARPQADRPAVSPRQPALTTARIEPTEGEGIAVSRTFARHRPLAKARRPRSAFMTGKSLLTPHDRETLILRIGWDCQAEYEWAKHVGSVGHARDHGIDHALVAAGPAAPRVADHDALLMRVADDLYQDSKVSDTIWIALLKQYGLIGAMSAISPRVPTDRLQCRSMRTASSSEAGDERFPARTG